MTCIVAVAHQGQVWMGADSAGVDGQNLQVRRDAKVFRNGQFLIGFTDSFRMGQLLRYSFAPPEQHADVDVMKFLVTDFVDAIRDCLKTGGFATKSAEAEAGGTFLVGYEGRVFRIEDDYQVGEAADAWDACGCGEFYARGALFATEGQPPKKRITTALQAAETYSTSVRGPFQIECL